MEDFRLDIMIDQGPMPAAFASHPRFTLVGPQPQRLLTAPCGPAYAPKPARTITTKTVLTGIVQRSCKMLAWKSTPAAKRKSPPAPGTPGRQQSDPFCADFAQERAEGKSPAVAAAALELLEIDAAASMKWINGCSGHWRELWRRSVGMGRSRSPSARKPRLGRGPRTIPDSGRLFAAHPRTRAHAKGYAASASPRPLASELL